MQNVSESDYHLNIKFNEPQYILTAFLLRTWQRKVSQNPLLKSHNRLNGRVTLREDWGRAITASSMGTVGVNVTKVETCILLLDR